MKLFLVRHGQTVGNVTGIAGLDPPLTPLGEKQVHLAGKRLAAEGITHLYCSPLFRAMQTTNIYRSYLSLEPNISPWFSEVWGKDWRGRTAAELSKEFPWAQFPDSMKNGRWWPFEAETEEELYARMQKGVDSLIRKHVGTEDRVCLISHVISGEPLLRILLHVNYQADVQIIQRNCAFTCIELVSESSRILHYLNDVTHLTPDLWT